MRIDFWWEAAVWAALRHALLVFWPLLTARVALPRPDILICTVRRVFLAVLEEPMANSQPGSVYPVLLLAKHAPPPLLAVA